MIPDELYKQILDVMPILCVDLVITNAQNQYLLVKRKNDPLKGEWFVPGGRVNKGESLKEAVARKAKQELGLTIKDCFPIGIFEYSFKENPHNLVSGVQGVSIAHKVVVQDDEIKLDDQSSEWKYFDDLPELFVVQSFIK